MGQAKKMVTIISTIEPRSAELKPALAGLDDGLSVRNAQLIDPAPRMSTEVSSQMSMAMVMAVRPTTSHLNSCSDGRARFFASGRTVAAAGGCGGCAGFSRVLTGTLSGTCARCAPR